MSSVDEAEAQIRAGMAAVRNGDFESAIACFRRAIAGDPANSAAFNNLGSALAALGRHNEGIAAFRAALDSEPNYLQAEVNLGESLRAVGDLAEAYDCFVRAIQIDPQFGPAYFALGQLYQGSAGLTEALACLSQAAELMPHDGDVFTSMGGVLMQQRQWDQAIQAFERALEIDPTMELARAHLMHLLARDCDWDRLKPHLDWVPRLGVVSDVVPPFNMLAFEDCPDRHLARSQRFAQASYGQIEPLPVPARPVGRPERLRIGYFSADFRDHATMFLAARMFELHDRERFSISAYSYGRDDAGEMRDRALAAFDQFNDVRGFSDRAIAERARADGIDIAIDLKGYTEFQRVGIFAFRPAPIQITYLGYPGTLGAPFIDYLIADPTVVPDEYRQAYSEQLIYLPNSYQANDDSRLAPQTGSRADAGLSAQGFVFCCFNHSYKISPIEFEIWMGLLREIEGSLLWLLASSAKMEANLRSVAAGSGVDPNRLIFAPRTDWKDHLARQRFADLFLDTFNCNAHTTASDALWMGVPLLTKAGHGFPSRVAASLLQAVGLDELITTTDRKYMETALTLARNPQKLATIRAKLADEPTKAPLFNSRQFTKHFEAGLELAYRRYLDGQPPADIIVPD